MLTSYFCVRAGNIFEQYFSFYSTKNVSNIRKSMGKIFWLSMHSALEELLVLSLLPLFTLAGFVSIFVQMKIEHYFLQLATVYKFKKKISLTSKYIYTYLYIYISKFNKCISTKAYFMILYHKKMPEYSETY